MNEKIAEILAVGVQLRNLFPKTMVSLSIYSDGRMSFSYHGANTYVEATEFFRGLGIGVRSKKPINSLGGYTEVKGEADGLEITTYSNDLPPTCKKVTVTKRIPKTQTIETGDYIEIQETRIECGEEQQ